MSLSDVDDDEEQFHDAPEDIPVRRYSTDVPGPSTGYTNEVYKLITQVPDVIVSCSAVTTAGDEQPLPPPRRKTRQRSKPPDPQNVGTEANQPLSSVGTSSEEADIIYSLDELDGLGSAQLIHSKPLPNQQIERGKEEENPSIELSQSPGGSPRLFPPPRKPPRTFVYKTPSANAAVENLTVELEADLARLEPPTQMRKKRMAPPVPPPPTVEALNKTSEVERWLSDSVNPKDEIILEGISLKNLDTGEITSLNRANELPQCFNPLDLQILQRDVDVPTIYSGSSIVSTNSDSDSVSAASEDYPDAGKKGKSKAGKVGRSISRHLSVAMAKVKKRDSRAAPVASGPPEFYVDDVAISGAFKFKAAAKTKGPYALQGVQLLQDLSGEHTGAIWCIRFSKCKRLLATAGQDHILHVWVLTGYQFKELKRNVGASPSMELISKETLEGNDGTLGEDSQDDLLFAQKPLIALSGHTADILDISWSRNSFLLSSSMDKTCRLWHPSRSECLGCFQHPDFVTAIDFHPKDDRYFLSGSLDGRIRVWFIPDKKVTLWNNVSDNVTNKLITAASFCMDGKMVVIGSYHGHCVFYDTDRLQYHTQISLSKSKKRTAACKISGICQVPGVPHQILVTSNDSRLRIYDIVEKSLVCKFKGHVNTSSQIAAAFNHDGSSICCGSEDCFIYLWKNGTSDLGKFSTRRDRNALWESIKVHDTAVTCVAFELCPVPNHKSAPNPKGMEILVSGDYTGGIKVLGPVGAPSQTVVTDTN